MERADVVAENSISRREIGVRDWRWFRAGLTWTADELSSDFRSGSELNLPILHFDQVFDFFAAVFFADLFGLLFHERTKVGQRARNLLSGFFLGIGESQKQLFDLLLVRTGIASLQYEGADLFVCDRVTDSVNLTLRFMSLGANALHRKQGVLGPAIAFFANA